MKKKILIVDDEEDMVFTLKIQFEKEGFDVLVSYDGQDALEKARRESPDVILLDLMLPKLDGYKVCRMLKFDEKYKDIPIVMFTARSQQSDKDLGFEVGANTYITKPFEAENLIGKVKELIGMVE